MRHLYWSADTQSIEMRCSTCHDWWPAEPEFFRVWRGSLGSQCRACHNDAWKQRAERKRIEQQAAPEQRA